MPERADEVLRRGRARALHQRAQAALLQQPRGEVRVRPKEELQVRAQATVSQGKKSHFSKILIFCSKVPRQQCQAAQPTYGK